MKKYNVAIVGVGVVGIELLRCLRDRNFPLNEIRVFARSRRDIVVDGNAYHVEAIGEASFDNIEIALFAGTEGEKGASKMYAQKFIEKGATVIDNGGDFRLDKDVPLIVPEANREAIASHKGLIANPNCTTIQAIVALAKIHRRCGLEKVTLVSFQATSGAGREAVDSLWQETIQVVERNKDLDCFSVDKKYNARRGPFPDQIAFNVIPHIGSFGDDDYTSEELKVVKETHKILSDDSIKISATCVRVPVFTSHSEAIYFTTREETNLDEIIQLLASSPGVKLFKHPSYPLPLNVEGTDEVYVGRVRRDPFQANSFWIWVVADNLRKGAALNAIQIAEELIKK